MLPCFLPAIWGSPAILSHTSPQSSFLSCIVVCWSLDIMHIDSSLWSKAQKMNATYHMVQTKRSQKCGTPFSTACREVIQRTTHPNVTFGGISQNDELFEGKSSHQLEGSVTVCPAVSKRPPNKNDHVGVYFRGTTPPSLSSEPSNQPQNGLSPHNVE